MRWFAKKDVTLQRGPFGTYLLVHDDGRDRLVQTDWDFPGVAANLGFVPCRRCRETDGTVSCAHKTASRMIAEAREFLDGKVGEKFEDPGYFGGEG